MVNNHYKCFFYFLRGRPARSARPMSRFCHLDGAPSTRDLSHSVEKTWSAPRRFSLNVLRSTILFYRRGGVCPPEGRLFCCYGGKMILQIFCITVGRRPACLSNVAKYIVPLSYGHFLIVYLLTHFAICAPRGTTNAVLRVTIHSKIRR